MLEGNSDATSIDAVARRRYWRWLAGAAALIAVVVLSLIVPDARRRRELFQHMGWDPAVTNDSDYIAHRSDWANTTLAREWIYPFKPLQSACAIDVDSVRFLVGERHLEGLTVRDFQQADVPYVANLKGLRTLRITMPELGDTGLTPLATLPLLDTVQLVGVRISRGLDSRSKLPCLTTFRTFLVTSSQE